MGDRAMIDAIAAMEIIQDHFPQLALDERLYWLVTRRIACSLRDSYTAHETQIINDLHVIDPLHARGSRTFNP